MSFSTKRPLIESLTGKLIYKFNSSSDCFACVVFVRFHYVCSVIDMQNTMMAVYVYYQKESTFKSMSDVMKVTFMLIVLGCNGSSMPIEYLRSSCITLAN